ncbi:unnamed protein product [Symbiodinium sp. KB8]|nr:unnamed protein product [Symbiodinium sp. KB8]
MPKRFYDDYSDMYLKNSSLQGRKQHMSGRRHINNKIEYWQMLIREKGLTPPIYPPPPGMVLPMPKLAAAANPTAPALAKLGGVPGMAGMMGGLPLGMPTMPKALLFHALKGTLQFGLLRNGYAEDVRSRREVPLSATLCPQGDMALSAPRLEQLSTMAGKGSLPEFLLHKNWQVYADVKGKPLKNENTFGYSAITVKSGMIMALGFLQTYNNAVLERATLEQATFQEVGLGFRVQFTRFRV